MNDPLTTQQAMERLNKLFAHLWMVRTFLKHSEEIAEDEEMLEVHRMIFDTIRATEPSHERGDAGEYIRRARGKLSKLKRVADFFGTEYRRITDHTNFQMAARSLTTAVQDIEEVMVRVPQGNQRAAVDDQPG
jgi:hypothetical protein